MASTIIGRVITIAGTDYSTYVKKADLEISFDAKDTTVQTDEGAKTVRGGLETGSLKIDFLNSFDPGGLDEVMWTAAKSRTPVSFTLKATDDATSTSNPKYSGYILVTKWSPINGAPGDLEELSVDFPTSGATDRLTAD